MRDCLHEKMRWDVLDHGELRYTANVFNGIVLSAKVIESEVRHPPNLEELREYFPVDNVLEG